MSDHENLSDLVNRAKARWLRRVMYCPLLATTQKTFAFAIADHLNCVTLDCWPAQRTLAGLLGFQSDKTVQRAAARLRDKRFITLTRSKGSAGYRYAPIFNPGDWNKPIDGTGQSEPRKPGPPDNFDGAAGQIESRKWDANVHQSFLEILLRSDSTVAEEEERKERSRSAFKRSSRGSIEIRLAEKLGPNGIDILARLNGINDAVVDRLCQAFEHGLVGERELAAARLAAQQAR